MLEELFPIIDKTDWDYDNWTNCINCCWCTYQGEREDYLFMQKLFLENEHPHGTPQQCYSCAVLRQLREIK